jgi:hypothetical protein
MKGAGLSTVKNTKQGTRPRIKTRFCIGQCYVGHEPVPRRGKPSRKKRAEQFELRIRTKILATSHPTLRFVSDVTF